MLEFIFNSVNNQDGNFGASLFYLFHINDKSDLIIDYSADDLMKCKKLSINFQIMLKKQIIELIKSQISFRLFINSVERRFESQTQINLT